jgi:hypothetical protein
MNLIKRPFTSERTEEERSKDKSSVYTIRLNQEEEAQLRSAGTYLQQPKLSTLIKQLALLCSFDVLQDQKVKHKLLVAINNVRRNHETGVPIDMPSDKKLLGNVSDSDEYM